MFPLDDIFVFGDIFFFLADIFFLAFAIGFEFAGGCWPPPIRVGRRSEGATRPRSGPPAGANRRRSTPPGKFETDGESQQKKILSQDKKKYSPTNENTHPTETPICLWYCLFLLMRSFYLTCHYFLCYFTVHRSL